jgi:uncharacterized protein YjbI with pentapeptide repeats
MQKTVSSLEALERLSIGESIQDTRITGLLDLDPLVVSRWLCGEDLRGVYQPIVLHRCILDDLDLEGRTFYEMVELVDCRVTAAHFKQAYFYANLLIEDCLFEGEFHGQGIQNDGRIVIYNTTFNDWAGFENADLRGRVDLVDVFFPGGTDLLHVLVNGSGKSLEQEIQFRGCRFRAADMPAGLEGVLLGITPLAEDDLGDAAG